MQPKSMGRWISVLYRQFQIYINLALQDLDISSSEYSFLIMLFHKDGVTQEELSSALFIDKAATARAIKSLEEKGYVKRERDIQDRRANQVYATEKAKVCKDRIHSALKNWSGILTEGMDPKTVDLVIDSLQEMSMKVMAMDFTQLLSEVSEE